MSLLFISNVITTVLWSEYRNTVCKIYVPMLYNDTVFVYWQKTANILYTVLHICI